jgi:hypothetical protein
MMGKKKIKENTGKGVEENKKKGVKNRDLLKEIAFVFSLRRFPEDLARRPKPNPRAMHKIC